MSDKNQDFWKELMGEDFKVDLDLDSPVPEKPSPQPAPPPKAPSQPAQAPKASPGFTIEYVKADGETIKPAAPNPVKSVPAETSAEVKPATPSPVEKASEAKPATPPPVEKAPEARPATPPRAEKAPEVKPATPPTVEKAAEVKPATPPPAEKPIEAKPATPPRAEKTAEVKPSTPPPAEKPAEAKPATPPPAKKEPEAARPTEGRTPRRRAGSRDKFEVEFDFDAEYPDVNEKALRRARTRRTGCLSGLLLFLFVISVSAVLAFVGWNWATDVLGLDGGEELVEVTLPRDIFHQETRTQTGDEGEETEVTVNVADVDAVAEELYQKGLIRYKWLFKLFSRFAHGDTKVQAGTYNLKMNYDYRALINGMNPRTGIRNTVKVTIPEGFTISQIAALMEENKVCAAEDFLEAVANSEFDYDFLEETTLGDPKRLEGFLFPDTYEFYENDNPDSVIKRFLNNFNRKWTDELKEKAQEMGYSVREILIVASMIEKEAGADSERDTIASVIYNRLADTSGAHGTNAYLQVDATIRYVIADTGENFSTEIDSPYNTYKYPGLPIGPIANPGLASIRAALNPASTKYYYYALGKTGTHRFFTNYDAFSKFVNSDEYGG